MEAKESEYNILSTGDPSVEQGDVKQESNSCNTSPTVDEESIASQCENSLEHNNEEQDFEEKKFLQDSAETRTDDLENKLDKNENNTLSQENITLNSTSVEEANLRSSNEGLKDNFSSKGSTEEDTWLQILGHDKLQKKVVKKGQGYFTRPMHGQNVCIQCSGTLKDGTKVDEYDNLEMTVGDGDVIQALDLCLPLMELEECCVLETDCKYAYGAKGRLPDIPENAHITYEIKLIKIENSREYQKLAISCRTEDGSKKRERGNWWFSREDYSSAINSYNKALDILSEANISEETTEAVTQLKEERIKCYNNLAAAQLKIEAWDSAIKSCDAAINLQPKNVKALFRKGKCLAGRGELESAITVLKKALSIEPETKIIHNELSRLMDKNKAQNKSAKEMYERMMGTNKKSGSGKQSNSSWSWYVGGAVAAAVLSAGIVAYRYVHL